jgi:hypothetical protein
MRERAYNTMEIKAISHEAQPSPTATEIGQP